MTSTEPLSTLAESAIWDLSSVTVNRAAHVETAQHKAIYELQNGTLAFNVTANDASALQGLISKDHYMFGDGGHLTVWLDDGEIVARIQSGDSSYTISGGTVKSGVEQSVALTFGDAGFKLYVGGELVDSNRYKGGLEGNGEAIVVGASQWSSAEGTTNTLVDIFKGTLSDIGLYETALSATEIAYLADPDAGSQSQTAAPVTSSSDSSDLDVSVDDSGRKRVMLAEHFDGDTSDLSLSGAPVFAWLNDAGNLIVDPARGDAGGYDFTITDADGNELEINLVVEDTSSGGTEGGTEAPVEAPSTPTTETNDLDVSVDDSGRKRVKLAEHFDGDTSDLSLSGAPAFAWLNDAGNLIVDPGIGDAGGYDFTITDADGNELEINLVVEDTSDGETEAPVEQPTTPTTPTTETNDLDVSVDDSGRKRVKLAEHFDGDTSDLSLSGAPAFAWLNDAGNLIVDPGIGDAGGYDFTITDADGNALEISLVVEDTSDGETEAPVEQPTTPPEPENAAPTIAKSFDTITMDEGDSSRITLADYFSDADGDALTMTLSGAPSWASVNANGKLILSPKDGDDGTYTFNIKASDGESSSANLSATIKIEDSIVDTPTPPPSYTPGDYVLSAGAGIVDGNSGTQVWGEGVTLTGYALNGNLATVVYSTEFQDDGFGVAGRGSRWDGQIDYYDINGGQSEKLVIDFNGDVEDVLLKVAMLGWREGPGKTDESGIWTALDEDGNVVGTGLIGPDYSTLGVDKKEQGSYGIYPIEIDPGVAFDSLVLEATQFDYGDGVSDTTSYSYGENSSDYAVSGVEFTRVEPVEDFFS